ncbi:hypothetical protein [uncultured Winogradskyella sp.]|uniref:hypothetical protein n=1 Tax=uncultured Winogradskyella sp. TaxID=395353 RepID=UPI00262AA0A5|nr:hypothetical protein [uncultured Winogradskyella sp.]
MYLKSICFAFVFVFMSFAQQSDQSNIELSRSLFTKGYFFSTQLNPKLAFKKGLFMIYNGDYNTIRAPVLLSRSFSNKVSGFGGLDVTTQLNSNNILLPVNAFSVFDVNAQFGGSYKFKSGTESLIIIQQRLFQINDSNSLPPALETKPINLNFGIKF